MHVLVGRNNFRARYHPVVPYQCVNIIASTHSNLIREFYFRKIKLKINKEYYLFDTQYFMKSLLYICQVLFPYKSLLLNEDLNKYKIIEF